MKKALAVLLVLFLWGCGGEEKRLQQFASWMETQSNRVLHDLAARIGPQARIIPPRGSLEMNFAVLALYLEGSREALDAVYVYMNYQKWLKTQNRKFLIKALSGLSHMRSKGINREKLRRLIDEGAKKLRVIDIQELEDLLKAYQQKRGTMGK